MVVDGAIEAGVIEVNFNIFLMVDKTKIDLAAL